MSPAVLRRSVASLVRQHGPESHVGLAVLLPGVGSVGSSSPAPSLAQQRMQHDASSSENYDVVIVGGGMVGAALASRLRSQERTRHFSVLLLDQGKMPEMLPERPPDEPPSIRVSTMTYQSVQFAQRCGVWKAIEPYAAGFSSMQVWEASGRGCIRWDSMDLGLDTMGHVVENAVIQAAFMPRGEGPGHFEVEFGRGVDSLRLPGEGRPGELGKDDPALGGAGAKDRNGFASLTLWGGRHVSARLVVAADGANSKLRGMAGIACSSKDYGQVGVTFTVRTHEPNNAAWQKFLPTGPIAVLPVRGGYSNVVWSTSPDMAQRLLTLSGADLAAAVRRALEFDEPSGPDGFVGFLRKRIATGPAEAFAAPPEILEHMGEAPRAFPLRALHAEKYVAPRLALVGDAAHAVHPLAGQGVNLGLGDAAALAEALEGAAAEGADFGDASWLTERYEAPRKVANMAMMEALDGIRSTFAVQLGPMRALRGLGLDALNEARPVKAAIMGYAMGLDTEEISRRLPGVQIPEELRRAIFHPGSRGV